MFNKIIEIVVYAIFGIVIGFFLGKGCDKSTQVPEVQHKTAIDTTLKIVHDTIKYSKGSDDVLVHKAFHPDTSIKLVSSKTSKDTTKVADTSITKDSVRCYSFTELMKDSAKFNISICSDSLPKEKPLDLKRYIEYVAPPLKQTTITIRDSTTIYTPVYKSTVFYKDWKFYTGVVAGAALVYYGSKHIK